MFCSLVNAIEMCKTEGVVDVFQVVKALRTQKPGAVQSGVRINLLFTFISLINVIASSSWLYSYFYVYHLDDKTYLFIVSLTFMQEQYRFIFELVLLFLDSFSIYSNFK